MQKKLISQIMAIFFDQLYHGFSWSYDLVAAIASVGSWTQWIMTCLPYIKGPRVLELGFGPGHLQMTLTDQGFQVFGLDESVQMIHLCSNRLRKSSDGNGYTKYWSLVRGLAQDLPFPNDYFDTIVSTFPSPYIIDPKTISQINRSLDPQGKFIIVINAEFTSRYLLDRIAAWLFRVTGQNYPDESGFIDRLKRLGFITKTIHVQLPRSNVTLLEAMKSL